MTETRRWRATIPGSGWLAAVIAIAAVALLWVLAFRAGSPGERLEWPARRAERGPDALAEGGEESVRAPADGPGGKGAVEEIARAGDWQAPSASAGESGPVVARGEFGALAHDIEMVSLPPADGAAVLPEKPCGRVVDALDARPIAGARVRAVFFHGASPEEPRPADAASGSASHDRAVDAWGAASWPALSTGAFETGSDGTFALSPQDPGDARLAAYVEVERAGYAPGHAVLTRRSGWDGGFGEVELRLRRALTVTVEVRSSDGIPMANAPLRVTAWRPGHSFLGDAEPLVAFDGRVMSLDEPELRFTDERGSFRLPFSGLPYDFELLHPAWFLGERRGSEVTLELLRSYLPVEGVLRLSAQPRWTEPHQLLDKDAVPVADAEILVELDDMPPQRIVTGADGGFTVGVTPYPPAGEPLGFQRPRAGKLTVLSPSLWKRAVSVAFPSLRREVAVPARPARALRFRAVAGETSSALPVEPGCLFINADLTLTRAGASGDVEFQGVLPLPGTLLDLVLAGYLPTRVVMPAGREKPVVDLGYVAFACGVEREVIATGAPREALRAAVLTVEALPGAASAFGARHRYRVGEDAHVVVGGLLQGVYTLAVEGPQLKPFQGALRVDESTAGKTLDLPLELTQEEDVRILGRVVDLEPFACAQTEVVESWKVAGSAELVEFPPYPLAPDGTFGSVRRLRGVSGVHVAIVPPSDLLAVAWIARGDGPPLFAAGELRLRSATRAEVAFEVEGLGRVLPPLRVDLTGNNGVESSARLAIAHRRLVALGLVPGNYALHWLSRDGVEESLGFRVTRDHAPRLELVAKRSPGLEEAVEVRVVNSQGELITGAVADPRVAAPGPTRETRTEDSRGQVLARVTPARQSEFIVSAPGYLPARVRVEAHTAVPGEVPLYRPSGLVADVLDTDGRTFEGRLEVSWEPLRPSPIAHGTPFSVRVERGQLHVSELPPVPLYFVFRPAGSDVAAFRQITLPEDGSLHIGKLLLSETRRISGSVFLPDGSPAADAVVGLVPRAKACNYPFHEGGVAHAAYSVKADAQGGQFAFDALPVDLAEDLVLVAHADGFQDAVESPLSLEPVGHDFVLAPETQLHVDAGYSDGLPRAHHGFWLEHVLDPADPGSCVVLAELPPGVRGGYTFHGIEPGIYRVRAGLSRAYETFPGRVEEAIVAPGTAAQIILRLDGQVLKGRAALNGRPLDRGWVLLTDDPAGGDVHVGRVEDGRLTLLDPPNSMHAYAAVIPEKKPQPRQNILRGEALPILIRDYRSQLRSGQLEVEYESVDLTIQLSSDFLVRHQGAVLSLDHQQWDRSRFEPHPAEEPIEGPTIRLQGLRPGPHRIGLRTARGNMILSQTVHLKDDFTLEVK